MQIYIDVDRLLGIHKVKMYIYLLQIQQLNHSDNYFVADIDTHYLNII